MHSYNRDNMKTEAKETKENNESIRNRTLVSAWYVNALQELKMILHAMQDVGHACPSKPIKRLQGKSTHATA